MSITQGAWSHKAWKTPGNSVLGLDSGSPDNRGVFVIHGVHLHTGKIMWWSGHAEAVHYTREIIVWDPTNTVPETDPAHAGKRMPDITAIETHLPPGHLDIFCAFHVQLSDGKILIMGGATHGASHPTHPGPGHGIGIKNSFIFNPTVAPGTGRNQAFTQKADMSQGRWYPTAVVLDDKSVVVFSGRSEATSPQSIADKISIFNPPSYNPVDISSTGPGGNPLPPLPSYPSIHMVKGGKMFYTGTNWKYEFNASMGPAPGFEVPVPTLSINKQNATTIQWDRLSSTPPFPNSDHPYREEGAAVLLSPAKDGKILVVGGNAADYYAPGFNTTSPFHYPPLTGNSSTHADILFTQGANPHWHSSTPQGQANPLTLRHPRINVNAVLLVDGTVLILGGHDKYKWGVESNFSKICEIFDPTKVGSTQNPFTEVAELNDPRTYHSSALLLKDGSVIVAGGVNPKKNEYPPPTDHTDNRYGTALNIKTFEIYKPPYLFIGTAASAPDITAVKNSDSSETEGRISYGRPFYVETPQASSIKTVVLMRLGAMTHHTDTEQRHIPFQKNASVDGFTVVNNRLRVNMFTDPTVAPHGYYMVFIINNAGRPCKEAKYVRLDSWIAHSTAPADDSICFIATAVYGSPTHPKVNFLKKIRDVELMHSQLGQKFSETLNDIYYRFSPSWAAYLKKNDTAKAVMKYGLVEPAVWYIALCLRTIKTLSKTKRLNSDLLVGAFGLTIITILILLGVIIIAFLTLLFGS